MKLIPPGLRATVLVTLILLGGAFAGTAAARQQVKTAKFLASAGVYQATTWGYEQVDSSPVCDAQAEGQGTQQVIWRAPRQKTTFFGDDSLFSPIGGLRAKVVVTRNGYLNRSSNNPCSPEESQPSTDCGERELTTPLGFGYDSKDSLEIGFPRAGLFWDEDPYRNCPIEAVWWDQLMQCTDFTNLYTCEESTVTDVHLPEKKLFSKKCQRIVVGGADFHFTRHEKEETSHLTVTRDEDTEMGWDVTLRHTEKRYRGGKTCEKTRFPEAASRAGRRASS